ncbi:unnamed protein product [Acidithrix sp. C25]|nr:unnamed protein product [Acidithrix sp. C25]CAG4903078.1 unnamed protein product [Acidithrix sp. C25]
MASNVVMAMELFIAEPINQGLIHDRRTRLTRRIDERYQRDS